VIDGATNTVIDRIHIGTNPSGVAVNPATNRIYVTLYVFATGNTVQVIDGATDAIVASVLVGAPPWLIDVNPVTNAPM
jgi:YVTN family beta-propeller protein